MVSGLVVENNLGCTPDGECISDGPRHFRLLLNGHEMKVVYHYGEWPRCVNNESTLRAEKLKEGDKVEIFGKVTSVGEISTCDSLDYYIQKLQ